MVGSSVLIAVLEAERTARVDMGGGGGIGIVHCVAPDSELYIIEAGRDRACRAM